MRAAPPLLSLAAAFLPLASAALPSSCGCEAGFPPLPEVGFQSISGLASCVVDYVQFRAGGKTVFSSGKRTSGGQPFSISCGGNATITGFAYVCNSGGGPSGDFPAGKFAALTSVGGIVCSDGSEAL